MPNPSDPALPPWAEEPDGARAALAAAIVDAEDAGVDLAAAASEHTDRWSVRSAGEAEWAMAHLAAAQAQIDAADEQRQLWQAKLDDWYRSATADARRSVEFFGFHLELYGAALRDDETNRHPSGDRSKDKVKTIHLASGTVSTRVASPQVVIVDESALIEWAEHATLDMTCPSCNGHDLGRDGSVNCSDCNGGAVAITYAEAGVVKITKKALLAPLRELVYAVPADDDGWHVITSEGEQIPGCDVDPGGTTAKPKPAPLGLTAGGSYRSRGVRPGED